MRCQGEAQEIVEYLIELQKESQKLPKEILQINLVEFLKQSKKINNNKKKEEGKKDGIT